MSSKNTTFAQENFLHSKSKTNLFKAFSILTSDTFLLHPSDQCARPGFPCILRTQSQ